METTLAGINLTDLTWPLVRVAEGGDCKKPFVEDPAGRFAAVFPKYIEEYIGVDYDPQVWWATGAWRRIPYKALAKVFTPDELARLAWGEIIQNEIDEYFRNGNQRMGYEDHPIPADHVLFQIRNGMWRWGWSEDYNVFVDAYEGLRRLTFHEGFEVRLDHARSCNERGTAFHLVSRQCESKDDTRDPVFLDGKFGLIVYYKGKHVLTVGFTPTVYGILIQQVQLREKKGNRWLFKLPKNYLEYVIDCFVAAFPTMPINLVEGESLIRMIRKSYGKDAAAFDAKAASERILSFYNQPLAGYARGAKVHTGGMTFYTLSKVTA
jgi:hypothetical protein